MRLVDIDLFFAEMNKLKNQHILPDYSSLSVQEKARLALYTQVIRGKLYSLPVVEAKPIVHGAWVEEPYLLGVTRRCNVCGENYGMPHGVFNFCPNCGADMRPEK